MLIKKNPSFNGDKIIYSIYKQNEPVDKSNFFILSNKINTNMIDFITLKKILRIMDKELFFDKYSKPGSYFYILYIMEKFNIKIKEVDKRKMYYNIKLSSEFKKYYKSIKSKLTKDLIINDFILDLF